MLDEQHLCRRLQPDFSRHYDRRTGTLPVEEHGRDQVGVGSRTERKLGFHGRRVTKVGPEVKHGLGRIRPARTVKTGAKEMDQVRVEGSVLLVFDRSALPASKSIQLQIAAVSSVRSLLRPHCFAELAAVTCGSPK